MANRFNKDQQQESRDALRHLLGVCTKGFGERPIIYTVLRTVSRSGMMRTITPFVIVDGKPVSLAWHYARTDGKLADESTGRWANRVPGCGMDMGYHLAENIAAVAGVNHFIHEWV